VSFRRRSSQRDLPPAVVRFLEHSGAPLPFAGALTFEPHEHHVVAELPNECLVARAFNHLDVIPADGRCVLATCHDGEVHGDFPSEAARDRFDAALRQAGYQDRWEDEAASSPG